MKRMGNGPAGSWADMFRSEKAKAGPAHTWSGPADLFVTDRRVKCRIDTPIMHQA